MTKCDPWQMEKRDPVEVDQQTRRLMRYIALGYLAEQTGLAWMVEVNLVNFSYHMKCTQGVVTVLSPTFDIMDLDAFPVDGVVNWLSVPLDHAISVWKRMKQERGTAV